MDNPSRRPDGAYTAPPRPAKTGRFTPLAAAGAGLAAAAGLTWLLAPGFSSPKSPSSAPAEPSVEPVLAMPEMPAERAAAPSAAAARARTEGAAPAAAAAPRAAEPPAWVKAFVSQRWAWPRRVGLHNDEDGVDRRLAAWFPANAPGRTFQFLLTADRVETTLFEEEVPAFMQKREDERRRREEEAAARARGTAAGLMPPALTPEQIAEMRRKRMEAIRAALGAATARFVTKGKATMVELTYADGRKEVVPFDPLVFDLKGRGVKTTTGKVLFDLYGYGKADKTQWMNDVDDGTGILVFDAKGAGKSGKDGSEVFGDRTDLWGVGQPSGLANGFDALRALVAKAVAEGVLPRGPLDEGLLGPAALAALEKAYGLRMKVGGFNREPVSLAQAGVVSIALSRTPTSRVDDFDGQGNDLLVQPGAVFLRADGTTGTYMNLWLKAKRGNLGLKTVTRRK